MIEQRRGGGREGVCVVYLSCLLHGERNVGSSEDGGTSLLDGTRRTFGPAVLALEQDKVCPLRRARPCSRRLQLCCRSCRSTFDITGLVTRSESDKAVLKTMDPGASLMASVRHCKCLPSSYPETPLYTLSQANV